MGAVSRKERSHLIHNTSLTAFAIARYSASTEDRDTTDCFLDFHEIGAPPNIPPLRPPPLPSIEDLSKKMMVVVRYKECLKNHAASMGGKATDGCGEFLPSGEEEIETVVQSLSLHPLNTVVNLNELFLAVVKGVVLKVAFERGFANLDAYVETILDDHHNQNIAQVSDSDKDFVDALLEFSTKKNASGYLLTKEDMKGLVMDVILGGTNTTAVTMVWAMSEITRNTRVMRKLQDEIRNCSGKKLKRHELDITKMIYLKMVVKETLRMHPPLPLLIPHESISQCQIDGHDIFPKTSTLINVWGIGRDLNVWGNNADEFYPERFVETEIEFGMIPFGGGRRSCPGMNTASATIEFILAYLLYWFDWDIPGGMKNQDMNMEEEGSLVLRKKMILRDGDERLTLNMRHDTSSYFNQPQRESINLINVFNNSSEDFLEDLFLNQPSGNPTFLSHPELTSPKVEDDIIVD
nr:cytochrome P450 71B34-like [Tanacetum cinerariifolium]